MKRPVGPFLALGLMACSSGGTVAAGRVQSVRYSGRTYGSSMDMDMAGGQGDRLGSFRLTLGDRGKLLKCL